VATTQTARQAQTASQDLDFLPPPKRRSTSGPKPATSKRQSPRSTKLQSSRQQPPKAKVATKGGRLRALCYEYSTDLVGLALILAGIIIACGVYGDFAGTLGRWVRTGLGASIGSIRFFMPPALLALGVSLIGFPEQVSDNTQSTNGFKIAFGSSLTLIGTSGLAHLAGGQPEWGDTYESFARAGGLLGAAFASPLEALMGSFVAGCVLGAAALFAIIVASRSTMGGFFRVVGWVLACLGRGCMYVWRALERLISDEEELQQAPDQRGSASAELPLLSTYAETSKSRRELYDYTKDEGLVLRNGSTATAASETEAADDLDDLTKTAGAGNSSQTGAKKSSVANGTGAEGATDAKSSSGQNDPSPDDLIPDDLTADDLTSPVAENHFRPTTTWTLPPADLLSLSETVDLDEVRARERGHLLEQSLEAHGVNTRLVGMVIGPTVTRYELELGEGVKVSRLTSLHKDIAYAMASPDVRILAPIPGRRAIGVEVPNIARQTVLVGDILNSQEAQKACHPLDVAVGRDITGRSIMMNLARMPHLLIAGATGSGKSSCVNTMLASILMRSTPEDLRMILVDPKMVEMRQFGQVPHLLTEPVVDPKKAANALNWAVAEMDRRYQLLSTAGFRDIGGYNEAYAAGVFGDDEEFPRLPFILVVVDELSDLMMVAARDVEDAICRIAQKARAVGIHLIIATQRPSADVLTGVIKANIPARLAFSVSSLIDSRVILDQAGAERLVGQGDMLLLGPSSSSPRRIQGAWVAESEVQKVVGFWRRQVSERGLDYVTGLSSQEIISQHSSASAGDTSSEDDELLKEAMEIIVNSGLGSTSMLQRKLRIGFARAGRLMDLLETRGVVGPSEGSKAREVYMTGAELAQLRAEATD